MTPLLRLRRSPIALVTDQPLFLKQPSRVRGRSRFHTHAAAPMGPLRLLEIIMMFVAACDLSESDMALLGNNIRPGRRPARRSLDERANRRVLAAVNRSLASLQERVDRLHSIPVRPAVQRAMAS